jgi:hypothetical protein
MATESAWCISWPVTLQDSESVTVSIPAILLYVLLIGIWHCHLPHHLTQTGAAGH